MLLLLLLLLFFGSLQFRALSIPHRYQVRLATSMLQEEASYWWKSMEKTTFYRREILSISWVEFVRAFNGQYFPESVVQKKALEFTTLAQREDSVREYAKNFLQLELFAPGILATDKARADKFFWGSFSKGHCKIHLLVSSRSMRQPSGSVRVVKPFWLT